MTTDKNMLEAVLFYIKMELDRSLQNKHQEIRLSPFENSGEDFIGKCFEVKSYNWDFDYVNKTLEEIPYNFRWKDLKVYWYKYLGRGMEWNREISNDELSIMLKECLEELSLYEKKLQKDK